MKIKCIVQESTGERFFSQKDLYIYLMETARDKKYPACAGMLEDLAKILLELGKSK